MFNIAKDKKSSSEGENETKSVISRHFEGVQCALEGKCAVCTCRKVHQVWNILAHDTGRHEIDREISAIIVLEAKSFTETRNLRRFLICNTSA